MVCCVTRVVLMYVAACAYETISYFQVMIMRERAESGIYHALCKVLAADASDSLQVLNAMLVCLWRMRLLYIPIIRACLCVLL